MSAEQFRTCLQDDAAEAAGRVEPIKQEAALETPWAASAPAGESNSEQNSLARLAAFNESIHRVRGRIEKIFGTWKRSYGLRRMRWLGIAKAAAQVHLTAIAYNLKRTRTITAVSAA